MLEKLQMYINGEWVDSHSTETIEVMNPSDDSVLGIITAGNSDFPIRYKNIPIF